MSAFHEDKNGVPASNVADKVISGESQNAKEGNTQTDIVKALLSKVGISLDGLNLKGLPFDELTTAISPLIVEKKDEIYKSMLEHLSEFKEDPSKVFDVILGSLDMDEIQTKCLNIISSKVGIKLDKIK